MLKTITPLILCLASLPGLATAGCYEDAMIVFDGSGSMSHNSFDSENVSRISSARTALRVALPRVPAERRLGLMTYGGAVGSACAGVRLHLEPRADAGADILVEIDAVRPGGDTPLDAAVQSAVEALGHRHRTATVVLVTDGIETCGGSVCTTARRIAEEGRDTTVHVVDFRGQGTDDRRRFRMDASPGCLAHVTGGTYHAVSGAADLAVALSVTLGCPLYGEASDPLARRTHG